MKNDHAFDVGQNSSRNSTRKPQSVSRLVAAGAFTLATLTCAIFSLSSLFMPAVPVDGQPDSHGALYTGAFQPLDGEFVGVVQVAFAQGTSYQGELVDGRFSGEGVFAGEGWTLTGNFVSGRLNGKGLYEDRMGTYTGSFVDSVPDGEGVYTSHEGWAYSGGFKQGAFSGNGTLTLTDGSSISGTFENGVLVPSKE